MEAGPKFECIRIADSPATIHTEEDVVRSSLRLAEECVKRPDASAVVIACFSDPGLDLVRSLVRIPVIGSQEAGIFTAMTLADRFGIIALSSNAVSRHMRNMRRMGVLDRLVGEVPLGNVSAEAAGTSDEVLAEALDGGRRLVERGAGAIVLGCAGFAPRRAVLEEALGVPVVDPVQAAGLMAVGAAQSRLRDP